MGQAIDVPARKRYHTMLRTSAMLLLTAALVWSLSGSIALDVAILPVTPLAPPAEDTAPADQPPAADATERPAFRTGDRLDADERAAFEAYAAALKAQGKHRGPAFYTSW